MILDEPLLLGPDFFSNRLSSGRGVGNGRGQGNGQRQTPYVGFDLAANRDARLNRENDVHYDERRAPSNVTFIPGNHRNVHDHYREQLRQEEAYYDRRAQGSGNNGNIHHNSSSSNNGNQSRPSQGSSQSNRSQVSSHANTRGSAHNSNYKLLEISFFS